MISSTISRASAITLAVGGGAMLFVADEILPVLAPDFPPDAAWIGQSLGAAWLGLAALNWLQRNVVLGGIYSRPIVLANLIAYFVTATSAAGSLPGAGGGAMGTALIAGVFAIAYGVLLLKGPFDRPS
jgi:hypothetical protein